jgi:hypothetical protein
MRSYLTAGAMALIAYSANTLQLNSRVPPILSRHMLQPKMGLAVIHY